MRKKGVSYDKLFHSFNFVSVSYGCHGKLPWSWLLKTIQFTVSHLWMYESNTFDWSQGLCASLGGSRIEYFPFSPASFQLLTGYQHSLAWRYIIMIVILGQIASFSSVCVESPAFGPAVVRASYITYSRAVISDSWLNHTCSLMAVFQGKVFKVPQIAPLFIMLTVTKQSWKWFLIAYYWHPSYFQCLI